jgi:hypothetical protein
VVARGHGEVFGTYAAKFCPQLIGRGSSIQLAISVMDFDNPLLTGLGISIDFLVVSLLDELVSVVV